MKRSLSVLILSAAYLGLLMSTVTSMSAQGFSLQNSNTISGFVFNESRSPIPQVYVELQSDFYSVVARVKTQESGMFKFSGLALGQYYLRVITSGTVYEEETKRVTLAALSRRSANTEQVDFYLRPRNSRDRARSASPGVVFMQSVPSEAEALYKTSLDDLAAKNERSAFEKLKKALEIFPDYFLALDRLGNEYVVRGHYEAAYVLLTKAIAVNKRSHSSAMGLGLALFRLGQTELAIDHFRSAVELEPASPNGHLWLGIALHNHKKTEDALKTLLKANELSKGESSEVHWQLARVYKDLDRFDESADELEMFLEFNREARNRAEVERLIESLRKKRKSRK